MKLFGIGQRATVATLAVLTTMAALAGPAAAAGGRNYDTNRDGKPDVAVVGLDMNGDRQEDSVLIDTNRNGQVDPGELLIQCPQGQKPRVKATMGTNGLRVEVSCGKDKVPLKVVIIQDQNGDGDTADAGEVRPG